MLWLAANAAAAQRVSLQTTDPHGKPFDLAHLSGHTVVITFASVATQIESTMVNHALKARVSSGGITVVSIIDLSAVPAFALDYARQKVAESDEPGLIHLIDDGGRLQRDFKVEAGKRVDILVLDRDGQMRTRFVGYRQVDRALHAIDTLYPASAALIHR